jgi:transposase
VGAHIIDLAAKIEALDRRLIELHKTTPISRCLAAIPGVGPITAISVTSIVNPENFESGRHFAAWLG